MDQKLIFRNATNADKEAIFFLANQLSEFIKVDKKIFTDNFNFAGNSRSESVL